MEKGWFYDSPNNVDDKGSEDSNSRQSLLLLSFHLLLNLLLSPFLQSQQKCMNSVVFLQMLLIQPQLHKQWNHIFTV